jgi:eukaryotic-like serine/threonine-protein kinase
MAMATDGRVLDDRYRLERLVDSGGFGEVWLASDLVLARPVTIKLLHSDPDSDAEMLARFKVEAIRASSIVHPNLARVFDYNDPVDGQPPFLVMESVEGKSLADLLASGPMPVPATLDVIAQVAAGVDAAPEAGLVHLDLRPENVVLSPGGAFKVTDFGIGRTADTVADLYPLGALAQACLRGQSAPVPADVAALIAELTDLNSVARPGSVAAVARRAAALREQLEPRRPPARLPAETTNRPIEQLDADPSVTATMPSWHQGRRRLLLVPVAAVIAVAAFLLLAGRFDRGHVSAQSDVRKGATTALVNSAAFRNLPVGVADSRLLRMGFSVRNRWQPSGSVKAGDVIAVSPTGRLRLGSVVTVLGSGPTRGPGRVMTSRTYRRHHHQGKHKPKSGPTGKPSHSPKATSSPSPQPTSTPSPSPTGTPSPTPSQTPTSSPTQSPTSSPAPSGSPAPSSSPSGPGQRSPTESPGTSAQP